MTLFFSIWDTFVKNFIGTDGKNFQLMMEGLKNTLLISVFACLIGIVIGSAFAIIRVSNDRAEHPAWWLKVLNCIAKVYITVIRGTPVALQLLIIYMGIFKFLGPAILIGSLAFGINSGAYVAENIRAGIMAVDKGQNEAGLSLGLDKTTIMKKIIAPQALKNILPALGNEFIAVIKETAILGTVSIIDLTFASQQIVAITRDYMFNLCLVGLIYLIIVMVLTYLLKLLERRLAKNDR